MSSETVRREGLAVRRLRIGVEWRLKPCADGQAGIGQKAQLHFFQLNATAHTAKTSKKRR